MKKLLLCIFVIALTAVIAFPQSWQVVKEKSVQYYPNDGFFLDANTGWLVGDDGVVLKTVDGCATWSIVREPDYSYIDWTDVEFIDANIGYACADDGFIFKTEDGGVTWTMIADTVNYKVDFAGLSAVTGDLVYFSGDDWTLLKTADGGSSFTMQGDSATFLGQDLDGGIAFCDTNVGVVIADTKYGYTWYTHDGGVTWNHVNIAGLHTGISTKLYDISAGGDSTIVIGGYHLTAYVSNNGGRTYSQEADLTFATKYFKSVDVLDANTYILGGSSGRVIKTSDGGTNWDTLYVESGQTAGIVDFIDANTGYIFSYYGQWFKTTDGGVNFTPLNEWPGTSFRGLSLPDDNKIVITAFGGGELSMSEDGGLTWSYPNNYSTNMTSNVNVCDFIDANNGIIGGVSGVLQKTGDGGASWSSFANPLYDLGSTIYSLLYLSSDTIYIGGSSGKIYFTFDGGTTWDGADYGSGNIEDIHAISDTKVIATAQSGRIYISDTTGGSFGFVLKKDYGSMDMNSVEFRGDVGIVAADDGLIYRTTVADWDTLVEVYTEPNGEDLHDVEFVDDTLVFIIGYDGTILKSTDAGLTWAAEVSPTDVTLHKVRYRNGRVWASGDAGTVLKCEVGIPILPVISIKAAKIDANGDYVPDLLGETACIAGVVNSINFDATRTSYYIQDATAGINVFGYGVQGVDLNCGDSVLVTGEVDQYLGLTEISISAPEDVELLAAGTASPDPVLVTLNDMMDPIFAEVHEGLLVKILYVSIVKEEWQSSYGDVAGAITDGTDTLAIRVYAETGIAYEDSSLVFDKIFHFTGIVSQYTYSDPPNDGYQMFPRDISDFEIRDPLTIAEAKIDADGDYAPDLYGEIVGVVGVVNSINFDATRTSYYIQDNTAGINVFGYGVQGVNLNYGDTVHVTGEVDQYKGLTEISISAPEDVKLLGAGTSSPEPVLVTLSDMMDPVVAEAHEGLLVKISNVYIVKDAWQSSYGDVAGAITDGTDTLTIRIYAETGIVDEDSSLVFDKLFHFTGIVSQYTSSDPPNDGYQMFPRDISDFEIISSIDEITAIPEVFALQQSYPNPFNPTASIKYDLPKEAMVRIIIYDIIGRKVRTLVNEKQDAGYKSIIWDGRDNEGCMVSSGMYIYQMITDEFQKTRKMTLLK